MAILIEPRLDHTETLLGQILGVIVPTENRVKFFVPAGDGQKIMSRLRIMLTRRRKSLEAKGRRPKLFKVYHTVHPETHNGKRFDCVVVWRVTTDSNWLSEQLQELLDG